MERPSAALYLVATPIGNREDITLRALRVLQEVDWVAAEDTRHSGQLLSHFQISARLMSYHEHNASRRIPQILKYLAAGQSVALISDAGTPALSDPGQELVRACIQAGIPVIPVPGPVAAVAALTASGLPTDRFVFEGFLPLKPRQRQARLQQLAQEERTIVLYEAPTACSGLCRISSCTAALSGRSCWPASSPNGTSPFGGDPGRCSGALPSPAAAGRIYPGFGGTALLRKSRGALPFRSRSAPGAGSPAG